MRISATLRRTCVARLTHRFPEGAVGVRSVHRMGFLQIERLSGIPAGAQQVERRSRECSHSATQVFTAPHAYLAQRQPGWYILGVARSSTASDSAVARTIRFPAGLRQKLATDAERCGRSFEAQVIALLRRHYGEDVDISPSPMEIVALATASMADISPADARLIERRLKASER
jgi:hypothetical protein